MIIKMPAREFVELRLDRTASEREHRFILEDPQARQAWNELADEKGFELSWEEQNPDDVPPDIQQTDLPARGWRDYGASKGTAYCC